MFQDVSLEDDIFLNIITMSLTLLKINSTALISNIQFLRGSFKLDNIKCIRVIKVVGQQGAVLLK